MPVQLKKKKKNLRVQTNGDQRFGCLQIANI